MMYGKRQWGRDATATWDEKFIQTVGMAFFGQEGGL
jgi:hypothetical protein